MKSKSKFKFELLKTLLAIGIALGIVFVIIFIVSENPLDAIFHMLVGPFSSIRRIGNIIESMTPLIFTGLSVILLYRVGLFNLSMEGGFFFSAVVATASAVKLNLPGGVNLVVAFLLAALAGGIISLIPGVLKVVFKANELVTSLMLNYVLLYLGTYVVINHLHDPSMNANYSYPFPENMLLSKIIPGTRINTGTLLALLSILLVYLILNKTTLGYKATLIGKNAKMSNYSGIRVGAIIMLTQFLGGVFTGIGGAADLFGMYKRFQYQGLPGFGWDGVLVAIVAQYRPELVPLSAFFLAYLRTGADIMSRNTDIPAEIIAIIQAVVIVLISAEALLKRYQHKLVVKQAEEAQ